jgi:hypothetical protein
MSRARTRVDWFSCSGILDSLLACHVLEWGSEWGVMGASHQVSASRRVTSGHYLILKRMGPESAFEADAFSQGYVSQVRNIWVHSSIWNLKLIMYVVLNSSYTGSSGGV